MSKTYRWVNELIFKMVDLSFIYVVSDKWKEHLRYEWLYIYKMSKFYQWWLKKNFKLYYDVKSSVILVKATKLTRWRFNLRDLMEDHKEKGEDDYHTYLSYFKPFFSDCSIGYYVDSFGLVKWKYYDGNGDVIRFLARENCPKVSHILLHQISREIKKEKRREFNYAIHDIWNKHLDGKEEFEYYNERYEKVSPQHNYMFVTMKVPKI